VEAFGLTNITKITKITPTEFYTATRPGCHEEIPGVPPNIRQFFFSPKGYREPQKV